jgi:hypothetical protein
VDAIANRLFLFSAACECESDAVTLQINQKYRIGVSCSAIRLHCSIANKSLKDASAKF